MLRIALPNKGRLADEARALFAEAGLGVRALGDRALTASLGGEFQALFVRAQDVAEFVADGAADAGVTGWDLVAESDRALETLLDQLRSGQRQVQPITVDLLLRSVDVLREMLSRTQRKQPPDPALAAGLHAELQAIVKSPAVQGPQSWRVKLVPGPLMMRHGNDPLRMLRELSGLGTLVTRVDAGKLPTQLWMNGQLNVSHADLLLPMNTGTFASQQTIDCSCIRAFWIVSGDMFDAPHPKG